MLEEVAQYIVLNLFIAFVIGLIFGYILGKGSKERFSSVKGGQDIVGGEKAKFKMNPIFNKSASLDFKPMVLSSSSKKDNLKKIKGIDEAIEEELYKLGIYQFEQISNWSWKNVEWVENFLNIPNHIRKNQWVEQAKILKTGKETNYSQKLLDNQESFKDEEEIQN